MPFTPDPLAWDARSPPLRIVKAGGSLLDWPLLPTALVTWLAEQPPARNVLICGGGALTDAIRAADHVFGLGETAAHWLCIDALSVSARLLAALLSGVPLVDSISALLRPGPQSGGAQSVVFDPRPFLRDVEPHLPGCVLPHTWCATTDAIAARVAATHQAQELVLLKSADPPRFATPADLAAAGYVDAHFPTAAAGLDCVRYVNVRRLGAA